MAWFSKRRQTPVPDRPAVPRFPIRPAAQRTDTTVPRPPAPRAPEPVSELLGRFRRPAAAVSCWAAIRHAGAGGGRHARIETRRAPDGSYWLRADVPPEVGAGIIWAAGGDALQVRGDQVVAIPGADPPPGLPSVKVLETWPDVSLPALLASGPRSPHSLDAVHTDLVVLVTGRLANHVIQRGVGAGAEVAYRPVRATRAGPAGDEGRAGDEGYAVLIRLTMTRGLPRSLVRTLAQLPDVVVGRAHGENQRLITALGSRLPVPVTEVLAEVPSAEQWVIGGSGAGSWTIRSPNPAWHGASELLNAPDVRTVVDLPDSRSRFLARPIEVRLVPDDRAPTGLPDAVLILDDELDNLRRYLTGRSLAESGFLTPGPAGFLIQEPSGLVRDLPLGQPLRRIGPGGLFVASGHRLFPDVPASGRGALFSVVPGQAVVVCDNQVRRFHLDNAVPIWSLWIGTLPPVRDQMSERSADLLRRLADVVDGRESVRPQAEPVIGPERHTDLSRKALAAETNDDPIQAAGLLQQAGDFAAAARLLERAAQEAQS